MNPHMWQKCLSGHRFLVAALAVLTFTQCHADQTCLETTAINNLLNQVSALQKTTGKPAWPPSVPVLNLDPATNRVKLQLSPVVIPDPKLASADEDLLHKLKASYSGSEPTGSWFEKVIFLQTKLGPEKTGLTETDYYPPIVDVKNIVKAIQSGQPLPVKPADDPDINLVRSPFTCGVDDSGKYDLVVLIESCVRCPTTRTAARETYMQKNLWGDFKVGFIFLLGMPAPVNSRIVEFEGLKLEQMPSWPAGTTDQTALTNSLLQEADKYKDMLIGDFADEFTSQTLQIIMGFRWASLFCSQRSSLFLISYYDYTLVPKNVVEFVRKIPTSSIGRYYGGMVFSKHSVTRGSGQTSNPWAVSSSELPWTTYPPFCFRATTFLGNEQINDATISMMYTRRFRFCDVYIGLALRRLGREPTHISQFYLEIDNRKTNDALGAYTSHIKQLIDWKTGKPT